MALRQTPLSSLIASFRNGSMFVPPLASSAIACQAEVARPHVLALLYPNAIISAARLNSDVRHAFLGISMTVSGG